MPETDFVPVRMVSEPDFKPVRMVDDAPSAPVSVADRPGEPQPGTAAWAMRNQSSGVIPAPPKWMQPEPRQTPTIMAGESTYGGGDPGLFYNPNPDEAAAIQRKQEQFSRLPPEQYKRLSQAEQAPYNPMGGDTGQIRNPIGRAARAAALTIADTLSVPINIASAIGERAGLPEFGGPSMAATAIASDPSQRGYEKIGDVAGQIVGVLGSFAEMRVPMLLKGGVPMNVVGALTKKAGELVPGTSAFTSYFARPAGELAAYSLMSEASKALNGKASATEVAARSAESFPRMILDTIKAFPESAHIIKQAWDKGDITEDMLGQLAEASSPITTILAVGAAARLKGRFVKPIDTLLTPEGAARFAVENPTAAKKLADSPSRVAGIPNMPRSEREILGQRLREIQAQEPIRIKLTPEQEAAVKPGTIEQAGGTGGPDAPAEVVPPAPAQISPQGGPAAAPTPIPPGEAPPAPFANAESLNARYARELNERQETVTNRRLEANRKFGSGIGREEPAARAFDKETEKINSGPVLIEKEAGDLFNSAETGKPIKLIGFRAENPSGEVETSRGRFFTPNTTEAFAYSIGKGGLSRKPTHQRTRVESIELNNPLVVKNKAEALRVLLPGVNAKSLTEHTGKDLLIARAAKNKGHDGIVYKSEQGPMGMRAQEIVDLRTEKRNAETINPQPERTVIPNEAQTQAQAEGQTEAVLNAGEAQPAARQGESAPPELPDIIRNSLEDANRLRKEQGLPPMTKLDERKRVTMFNEAVQTRAQDSVADLAAAALRGEKPVYNEVVKYGFDIKMRELKQAINESRSRESADPKSAPFEAERRLGLTNEMDLLTRGHREMRAETSRTLGSATSGIEFDTGQYADAMQMIRDANGSKPVDKETESLISHWTDQIKAKDKEIARLREKQAVLDAEAQRKSAERLVKRESRKSKIAKGDNTAILAEREQLWNKLKAMGLRLNDITGVGPEGAYLIGRLGINYIREGAANLKEVVDRVRQDLPDLSERDVWESLTAKPPARSPELIAKLAERSKIKRQIDGKIEGIRRASEYKLMSRPRKALHHAKNITSELRSLQATGDMSGTFRQGFMLIGRRPVAAARAFVRAGKAMFDGKTPDKVMAEIREMPTYQAAMDAKLHLSEIDGPISAREEFFQGQLLERIPILRSVMRASNRHMTTYLNMLRMSAFDQFARANPNAMPAEFSAWADYVNKASGVGDLSALGGAAKYLSQIFFAPKFAASRFQAPWTVIKHWKIPSVRKAIAADMAATVGIGMTAIGLAAMAGAKVSFDPTDSDFGKMVFDGDTHIDFWGGFQQPFRLILGIPVKSYKVHTGQSSGSPTGRANAIEDIGRFLSYKLNPTLSLANELAFKRDMIGKKQEVTETLAKRFVPMIVNDVREAYNAQLDWRKGAAAGVASGLGMGVNTYQKKN